MNNKIAFLTTIVLMWLAVSCGRWNKCVENPLIESANTMAIDITKVELSDTATVLYIDVYFLSDDRIEISAESYLLADDKRYFLTGVRGCKADSLSWIIEPRETSFQLIFEPLPYDTRSFDFIEGDDGDCFKLFGIDLTGKKIFDSPADIPVDITNVSEIALDSVPAPLFEVGETVVRMHFSGYRKELAKEAKIRLNTLMNGQQIYTAEINTETDMAEFKFWQYGPAQAWVNVGVGSEWLWLVPGEKIDLYMDMRWIGQYIVKRRAEKKHLPAFEVMPFCYSTGRYAGLSVPSSNPGKYYGMDLYSGEFADDKMTAVEYTRHVIDCYKALVDSIAQSSLSPVGKELALLNLRQEAVVAMARGDFFREHNYRKICNQWGLSEPLDIKIDSLTAENRAELCKLFSVADPKLLMGRNFRDYVSAVVNSGVEWPKSAGLEGTFVSDLKVVLPLVQKALSAAITEVDLKVLENLQHPFWQESLLRMQENALAQLKILERNAVIEKTPDVPVEDLFDAIIAPYKGKFILVDFWNTWCVPCRVAIKANEPLKNSELKSDNLVWIYIANETSPIVAYKKMISEIQGKHYRLTDKQWAYFGNKFKMDGIPSYVLVDKRGQYALRNDFRDHEQMKKALKQMIK